MDRDVFREDVLEELFVEEVTVDVRAAEDALKEAHNLSLYLADVLAGAAGHLPSGDLRDRVSDLQSDNIHLLCEIGDTLRTARREIYG
jgi:hypothetical protein